MRHAAGLQEEFLFCFVCVVQVFRVFYDRLVDDGDRDWLFNSTRGVIKEQMREDFDQLFAHLDFDNDGKVVEDDIRSLIYCDFADPKSDAKNYVEVRDLEKLRVVAEGYLEEFNNLSKKPMNLVLFRWVSSCSISPSHSEQEEKVRRSQWLLFHYSCVRVNCVVTGQILA